MSKKSSDDQRVSAEMFEANKSKKNWPREDDTKESKESTEKEEVAGALEHPSYEELEKKLDEAESKANDYWNQNLRLRADMENAQRRARQDVSDAHKYGLKNFALELLPIIDSIERGLLSDVKDNALAKKIHEGMEITLSMMLKTMEKCGIQQVDPQGQFFNPNLHQAISIESNPDFESNQVISVLQKGYLLNDRLLRPALVIVAK